jgi:hypothetical protein
MPTFNLGPALIPSGARRIYRLPILGCELELAPMTKANKAYWSEFLRLLDNLRAAGGDGEAIDLASQTAFRLRDAELMAKHVLLGWKGVTDAEGNPVAFSQEKGRDFLVELATTDGAEHLFDDLRGFAKSDANFTNAGIAAAKALAGN